MPIYTRFGDRGETMSLTGKRVSKDSLSIEAQGQLDELNSVLGVVIAFTEEPEINELLTRVQKEIFILGAELAMDRKSRKKIGASNVEFIEKKIDSMESELGILANFVIPGGSRPAALLHYARTVCRRCERRVVSLSRKQKIDPEIMVYLNRLSDLLFTLARYINRKKHVNEIVWKG